MKKICLLSFLVSTCFFCKISAQGCLPGGITFKTQAEIDSFATNYPGCAYIMGNVTIEEIENGSIKNLSGLAQISAMLGFLVIYNNDSLTSLSGMENLTSIGRYLTLEYNKSLTSLSGLDNLATVTEGIRINENPNLTSLTGLGNLTYCGDMQISSNHALANMSGMDKLTFIPGNLTFFWNHDLLNLSGLDALVSIGASLIVSVNNSITSLEGLENLTSLGTLGVYGNSKLASLSALENLTTIKKMLFIGSNSSLANLSGLDNLTTVGRYMYIGNNFSLVSLSGLENLEFLGDSLRIENNKILTSLSGIDSAYFETMSVLDINKNPHLTICNVPSVCTYLQNGGNAIISKNALGCNDEEEILANCPPPPPPFLPDKQEEVRISPNPVQGSLNIEYDNQGALIYIIRSYTAITVMSGQLQGKGSIDVSGLPNGLYFLEMKVKNQVIIKKMLKLT